MAWIFTIPVFGLSQASFWQTPAPVAYAADSIADLEEEKDSIEDDIEKEEKAKTKLEQSLGQIQSAVSSTQSAINFGDRSQGCN